jgi:hypothetical protein
MELQSGETHPSAKGDIVIPVLAVIMLSRILSTHPCCQVKGSTPYQRSKSASTVQPVQ